METKSPSLQAALDAIAQKTREHLVGDGEPPTIEESYFYCYERPCVRVPPGHPDALGYNAGSVLIHRDSIVVVCDQDDKNFEPPAGLERVALCVSELPQDDLCPRSVLYKKGIRIEICLKKDLVRMRELNEIINRYRPKVAIRNKPQFAPTRSNGYTAKPAESALARSRPRGPVRFGFGH